MLLIASVHNFMKIIGSVDSYIIIVVTSLRDYVTKHLVLSHTTLCGLSEIKKTFILGKLFL